MFLIAAVLLGAAFLVLRRQAGGGALSLLPIELSPIVLGWLLLLSLSRRPVLAAVLVLAAALGLALTDAVKRTTLREPLVFADRAELLEVVRHPRFYLPFAGPATVIGGAVAAIAAAALLAWVEPPAWHSWPWQSWPLAVIVLVACGILLPGRRPFGPAIAARYRRLGVSGDPALDMRRLGFLTCLIVHATLARDERRARRAAVPALAHLPPNAAGGPVVLIQLESFFDARGVAATGTATDVRLPGFDRMAAEGVAGRLSVPCWGANTVRSEFMVLTGIDAAATGLDRFNPYERFALARTRSLAWTLKAAGYRTICLHPFDKTFYGRDRVMPLLGFDEFRGPEVFQGAARRGHDVSDAAIGQEILRILETSGPRVFVFAITIANHGPWKDPARPEQPELEGYLDGLQASDEMLRLLVDGLPAGATLAVYGDHQPSLPDLGSDERTDYAIWRAGATTGGITRDLLCAELASTVLSLLRAV